MNKLLLVNKDTGCTSRDVVNELTKIFNTKKIGHFGTLDPLASGLLLIGFGRYTKLGNLLENDTKEYVATVLVGKSTDTYDITGTVLEEKEFILDKDNLNDVLSTFIGTYTQEVPIYSAVKVNGKKLYEYAREGKEVSLPKKEVTVFNIELLEVTDDSFTFKCLVSKGTYIRSLINDISKKMSIPMCMKSLVRTKQDKFSLEESYTMEEIKKGNFSFLNIRDILDLDVREIPLELEKKVLNGAPIDIISNNYILFTKNDDDIVLYGVKGSSMRPILYLKTDI